MVSNWVSAISKFFEEESDLKLYEGVPYQEETLGGCKTNFSEKEVMHRWFTDDENVSQTSLACLRKGEILSSRLYGL